MNRHTLARFLRLAVMACVLLSCLTALQTPALAVSIYNILVQTSISTPGPLPSGTSISFLPGSIFPFEQFSGNAIAAATASVSPPGSATALVTGFAGGPAPSSARSFAAAIAQANIVNQNASTVTFPLTFSHSRSVSLSTIPSGDPGESSSSGSFASFFFVELDDTRLLSNFSDPCFPGSNCNSFDSGSAAFLFGLTPGSHSLRVVAEADGFANVSPPLNATPEPATLLLVGTTMAGIGLARWRQRRRKEQEP
jgi:hypothetical protein